MKNVYKEATRKGLVFLTERGSIGVSDLWLLSLDQLDALYKVLSKALKESDEDSLLVQPTKATADVRLRFELVKDVMLTKLEEAEDAKKAVENKERAQYLMSLKAKNQQARDSELTDKEIDKELKKLG